MKNFVLCMRKVLASPESDYIYVGYYITLISKWHLKDFCSYIWNCACLLAPNLHTLCCWSMHMYPVYHSRLEINWFFIFLNLLTRYEVLCFWTTTYILTSLKVKGYQLMSFSYIHMPIVTSCFNTFKIKVDLNISVEVSFSKIVS